MAISIVSRPEKTLSNGYLSRWNASATPLQYKFDSTLFPNNTEDVASTLQGFSYDSSVRGTKLNYLTIDNVTTDDYVKVDGTGKIDGIYKVKDVQPSYIVIDLYTTESEVTPAIGTFQRYYKGYKGLAKVFVGSPEYHTYNPSIKPQREIGIIEIDFTDGNEGVCNVRSFVKPDMSADFDYDHENSIDAWTAFSIEYAEIWDGNSNPSFTEDILDNCFPFAGFDNPSFDSGLTDWTQVAEQITWVAGTGEVIATGTGGSSQITTNQIGQNIELRANIPYQIEINYNLVSGTVSDNFVIDILAGTDVIYTEQNIQLGAGVGLVDFTPTKDYTDLYFRFKTYAQIPQAYEIRLTYFQVTTSVANQCKYSAFSIFGAKQFGDSLGANFGDYITSVDTAGNLLTHFEVLKYPFLVNAIIPNATFNRSEGNDSVFLEMYLYDSQGVEKEYIRQKIENKNDGVYTIDPNISIDSSEWSTGTAQIISVPNNLLLDGDNGTFDDATPANWNISEVDAIANGMGTANTPEQGNYGVYNMSFPSLTAGVKVVYQYDTPIQTVIGQTYILNAQGLTMDNFSPNLENNASFYYRIKGTNFVSNKFDLVSDRPTTAEFNLSFEASSDSHQIEVVLEVFNDSGFSGGASLSVDNVTFKGPIEFLSEQKPIKTSTECSEYTTLVRWKNDLGGWEKWNFKRFRTFKEEVSNKVEIRRDVTQDWDNYFINGDTEYDTIHQDVRKVITLRSELLTENEQEILNQIRRSIKVQILVDVDKWQTVTITGGSYELFDEDTKIREVSFDVKLPNTLVQEQ